MSALLKLLTGGNEPVADPRLVDLHPRHVGEHFDARRRKDASVARTEVRAYLAQLYSKYLAEDKQDGTTFDIAVLDALEKGTFPL